MERDVIFGEVIRQYFETVAEEMNTVLDRTAMSQIFNEAHDCSAGIFSLYDGRPSLIARANAEPVHIYASLESVRGTLQYYRNDLHQGDLIIVNDPTRTARTRPIGPLLSQCFMKGVRFFFPVCVVTLLNTARRCREDCPHIKLRFGRKASGSSPSSLFAASS